MSASTVQSPVRVLLVAVRETAGSALYGMLDVLNAAGNIWQSLVRSEQSRHPFDVGIVAEDGAPFKCGNGIPVEPDCAVFEEPAADVVILPELWLGPDEDISGRYPALVQWVRGQYEAGACVYSACSGAIMLAETGLLDGRRATSHWGYRDLFTHQYPKVQFQPEPNLVFADPEGRIVTAGGTTSWHDLAIHIISRYCGPGEALRIAKVYLLKWHDEGQLPYAALIRNAPHADAVVKACESWLGDHFRESGSIQKLMDKFNVPERTLKRRFKNATGGSLQDRVQALRIEEAKRQLETGDAAVEDISSRVGYEDSAFFRRLFKRLTGLTPAQYRKLFQPVVSAHRIDSGGRTSVS